MDYYTRYKNSETPTKAYAFVLRLSQKQKQFNKTVKKYRMRVSMVLLKKTHIPKSILSSVCFISGLCTTATVLLFIFAGHFFRQNHREELKKDILFLSYKLHEIELCSFQVLANRSLNTIFSDYVSAPEEYQISKWNKEFSAYIESFIEENFLVRDVVFFPIDNTRKKVLTAREDLTFNEIQMVRHSRLWEKTVQLNGKLLWYNTGTHLLALRILKAYDTKNPLGIICFYVNIKNLNRFIASLKYMNILITAGRHILFPLHMKTPLKSPIKDRGTYRAGTTSFYTCYCTPVSKNNALVIVSYLSPVFSYFFYSYRFVLLLSIVSFMLFLYSFRLKNVPVKKTTDTTYLSRFLAQNNIRLTDRELTILTLICKGLSNKEIACTLTLEEQTVKNYTSVLYKKLGVTNRVAACNAVHTFQEQKKQ